VIRLSAILFLASLVRGAEPLDWQQLAPLPEPLGVAAPFAGGHGEVLLVAGGANFPHGLPWEGGKKVWHDRVWVLEKPNGTWRAAGRLPRPLAYGVSVSTPGGVVCVGGSDAGRHYADVFRLSWTEGALTTEPLPPLPIALAGACGALAGGTLVVACGSETPGEQSATNRAFAIDLCAAAPAWRELPPLPGRPRFLAASAAADGRWFVLGGAALAPDASGTLARVPLREAWSYHPEQGWRQLADLPRPAVAAPSPAPWVNGRFWLISGDDGTRTGVAPAENHPGFPKTILAYDPARDHWTEAGATPAPRVTVPCVEWAGRFVIPSGEVRPGVRSPEIWTFRAR
jgi:N-acetylneuraminate epimerase